MKKILLLGSPFHMLEHELKSKGITFDIVSMNVAEDISYANYDAIVFLGMNVLLNTAKMNIIQKAYAEASHHAQFFWWTHESFWDYRESEVEYIFGRKTYVFNCYNGLVHTSPFAHYFGVGGILWRGRVKSIELPSVQSLRDRFQRVKERGRPVCAYATCFHDFRLYIPKSLVSLRNSTIKSFWDRGLCDVYGKNWTGQWSVDVTEESRGGIDGKSWGQIKVEHSRDNYLFSICVENSLIKNYVTEKFAQAIESHLLPIYVFGNDLENYFDTNAAIAINSSTESIESAMKVVESLTFDEYHERLTSLTADYNKIISQTDLIDKERVKPAKILVRKILETIR